jgi:uncharacterized membrane protein (UPF0127 family)
MPRFLQPLAALGAPMIINARSGRVVASKVQVATTRTERRRGLLGRDGLESGAALVLAPCRAVHTIGMRFPIDVVFITRDGEVVRTECHMSGWQIAISAAAAITIELGAGAVQALDIRAGDRLCLAPAFAEGYAPEETRPFEPAAAARSHQPAVA